MDVASITTELICPLLCKCVVISEHLLGFTPQTEEALAALPDPGFRAWLRQYWADQWRYNTILEVQHRTEMQCDAHSHLGLDADHYEGIKHLHGNAHSPDTCGCTLAYWFDDRSVEKTHHPVRHPMHTVRCEVHKHLWEVQRHYWTVKRENYLKNAVVNTITDWTGIAQEKIVWGWNRERHFIVDPRATGISEADLVDILAFVPPLAHQPRIASGPRILTHLRLLEAAA